MLTKGNFTRDEWNDLLNLLDKCTSCPETMTKWMQEEKGEERTVAKSKPTLNLVSHGATSSSTVQSPIASKSPRTLRAPCQQDWKSTGLRCNWTIVRGDSWRQRRTRNSWISMKIWRVPGNSLLQETQTAKVQSPCIYYLHPASWEEFLEGEDRDNVSVRGAKWDISMWIWLYGEYLCPALFKLQILGKIIPRIYVPSKINPWNHWSSYSIPVIDWMQQMWQSTTVSLKNKFKSCESGRRRLIGLWLQINT